MLNQNAADYRFNGRCGILDCGRILLVHEKADNCVHFTLKNNKQVTKVNNQFVNWHMLKLSSYN